MAAKRMTLHSGRYNASPKHNDRTFDLEKADHIDIGRLDENYYWECASGKTSKMKNMHEMSDAEIQRRSNTFIQQYNDIRDEIDLEMD